MSNETYDEYIRSILGKDAGSDLYDNNYDNEYINYEQIENRELENYYPEIYKVVYPMIKAKCNNSRGIITRDELENMTDEIYYAIEQNNEINLNININNDMTSNQMQRQTRSQYRRTETNVSNINNKRGNRQFNYVLRDLVKILLIRELLGRPGSRPPPPPRPPYPGPRPPYGRPPFHRDEIQEDTNNQ